MSLKPIVTIVCGPTATGKTNYALKLAQSKPTSLLSADSRQLYRDLSLVSGKDLPADFQKISADIDHYSNGVTNIFGLDLLAPSDQFSASDFSQYGHRVIQHELARGREVLVVGGTGFYLKALAHPDSLANVAPNPALRLELEKLSLLDLQSRLKAVNPNRFESLNHSDQNNPRRLIRALEISLNPPTVSSAAPLPYQFIWHCLTLPLTTLKGNIHQRVVNRLAHGAVEEIKNLLTQYPDRSLPIYNTLGVSSILNFLDQKLDEVGLIEDWASQEFQYAKRQLTWFKKQPEIIWYDESDAKA